MNANPRKTTLTFIGAGNMAEALIKGLLQSESYAPGEIYINDLKPERKQELVERYQVRTGDSLMSDAAILAVKPQALDPVLEELAPQLGSRLVISLAAGVSLQKLEQHLGPEARIIRTMPNTPALVGAGATALAANSRARPKDLELALQIFQAVGKAVVVDESLMDAVTGLSGSGPAYGLVMIEAMSDAGVKLGLGRAQALELAAQTLLGAAKMVLETGEHPAVLKDRVCSPGGTTIAGVLALEEAGLRTALAKGVLASAERSKQLGEELARSPKRKESKG